jgi:hypothetical protein
MVIRKNKKIEIIGFENKPCYSLIQKANKYYSLKQADLIEFIPKEELKKRHQLLIPSHLQNSLQFP